ncbi:MAG: hypothetical protein AAF648_11960 [Pseudomonadota bacterium]
MSVDGYGIAWLVVFGAGLVTLGCWFMLTRAIGYSWLRTTLRCLVAGWILLPAPVPGFDGQYAPAYIVVLFEAVFQKTGSPDEALRILLIGTLVILALLAVPALLRRVLRRGLIDA